MIQSRASKGSVTVEEFRGKLRLHLPRFLYGGKNKYLSTGLDNTPENKKLAEAKAKQIEKDIAYERFDPTLNRYRPEHLQVIESPSTKPIAIYTCAELWKKYFEFKESGLKELTCEKYKALGKIYEKVGSINVLDALEVKEQLETFTTTSRTKDALMYLNACCKWAVQHKLIFSNPYLGMYNELPQHRYQIDPKPNAFTIEERDRIIELFKNDSRPGMNYKPYAPFVEFLFRVGCRPSEAVGLQWKHVSDDGGSIYFEGALVQVGNRRVRSKGSKNNKTRKLTVSLETQKLLQSIKPENCKPDALVFPSPAGDSINYRNFARRAWSSIVDPIKPDTTPYCCRDTFITVQLMRGTPSTVVAQYCDTSTAMIDKNYADKLKLTQLRPSD